MASNKTAFMRWPVRARMGNRFPPCRSRLRSSPTCHGLPTTGGPRRFLYAGQGNQDHIRTAIQLLSGEVPKEMVYAHLGWQKIMASGFISMAVAASARNGLIRDLSVRLRRRSDERLYFAGAPHRRPVEKGPPGFVTVFGTGAGEDHVPLIAATYRAPLGEIVPIDFSTLLAGLYWDAED